MNEVNDLIIQGRERIQSVSTLQDPFKSKYFERMTIYICNDAELATWRDLSRVHVVIRFSCGPTSGEQKIDADTLIEALDKIAAFHTELMDRETSSGCATSDVAAR
jgi:hypothetical protein